ncbi:MAG TPA: hypothetical protein VI363_09245, partial [Burkholderiales bacterium]
MDSIEKTVPKEAQLYCKSLRHIPSRRTSSTASEKTEDIIPMADGAITIGQSFSYRDRITQANEFGMTWKPCRYVG